MIIKRTLACLSAVSVLLLSNMSYAEMGPYVGVGGGYTKFDDDGFIEESTGDSDWDDSGTAYRFIAGYKFSENFSVEWSYQDYDYNEYGVDSVSEVDMQAWHVSGVLAYPIYESALGHLDLFGKLGFGESDYTYREVQRGLGEEQSSESLIFGGGAQFYMDEHFRIRTELDFTTFNLDVAFGTEGNTETFQTKDYTFIAMTASASVVYLF